jgi:hypothetical protein
VGRASRLKREQCWQWLFQAEAASLRFGSGIAGASIRGADPPLSRPVPRSSIGARTPSETKDYPFSEMMKSGFVRTRCEFMSIVDEWRCEELADRWSQNPTRYPFYSAFIEGALYSAYYAMIENNRPLDRNAQADYEQLAYLLWADVIVSNEANFFHNAFQTLWAPRVSRCGNLAGLIGSLITWISPSVAPTTERNIWSLGGL